jgi:site-specific DNA-cytosine methylase
VGDIHTMQPADLLAAWGPRAPNVVFSSTPCKGLSRLLGAEAAAREEYQALNMLTLEAFNLDVHDVRDEPPELLILENVPGIMSRGADLLAQIRSVLTSYGYRINESTHDCGELGGLGQHRRRFLLVARHEKRLPALLYQPPKQRVKACGEIIGPLPLPNAPDAGPLHVLPAISWINWARLAMIPPGGDWRDLPRANAPEADNPGRHENKYRITPFEEPAATVIGATRPGSGSPNVADARVALQHTPNAGAQGVMDFFEPAKTVRGASSTRTGPASVADARVSLEHAPRPGSYSVSPFDEPASTVRGVAKVQNGGAAVADPRLAVGLTGDNAASFKGRPGYLGVQDFGEPAIAVIGKTSVSGSSGRGSVADPRLTSPLAPGQPRREIIRRHAVQSFDAPHPTVTGPGANAVESVADPRLSTNAWENKHASKYRMRAFDEPVGTITGDTDVQAGAQLVADSRVALGCTPRANKGDLPGAYGVLPWTKPAGTVTGSASIDNGPLAIADGRVVPPLPPGYVVMTLDEVLALATSSKAKPPKGMVPVIFSPHDGTWHRPLTTLELAALQGLPTVVDGAPLTLDGRAAADHRERIGNAVPVGTAKAIASEMLRTLLVGTLGLFVLGGTLVWVKRPPVPAFYARRRRPDVVVDPAGLAL